MSWLTPAGKDEAKRLLSLHDVFYYEVFFTYSITRPWQGLTDAGRAGGRGAGGGGEEVNIEFAAESRPKLRRVYVRWGSIRDEQ